MAKARSASKSPLEWVSDTIQTVDSTVTNGRIQLRLDRDEVAEIRKVVITVSPPFVTDAADDLVGIGYMVSMDPDVIAAPLTIASREDLEVFMSGDWSATMQVGAAGQTVQSGKWRDELSLPEGAPILVGSDIGWVVQGDAALAIDWVITIYLTRRRAKPNEKFNVLLSRR
jgi:hypothetical protein